MKKKWLFWLVPVLALAAAGGWGFNKWSNTGEPASVFYVPNAGDGSISVVNPNDGKKVDTIPLGTKQASHGIAISPDGGIIYSGTGFEGKSLLAIDTKTKKIVKELKFTEGVHGIDIGPDGKYLYVSLNPGLGKTGGGLAVVDTVHFEQKALIQTGEGPAHVAVTADGSQVWVANVNGNTVAVVDARSNKLLKVLPVGKVPNEVAVSPDGKRAFVANVNSNTVSVIDTLTFQTVAEIQAGEAPHGVTVSPDGKQIWVANNKSNDVSVIDGNTLKTVATIPTGAYANHVAFSVDGKWAFVTNRQSNDIVKIDVAKRTVTARIPVGTEPHEISLEDYVAKPSESSKAPLNKIKTGQSGPVQIDAEKLGTEDLDSKQQVKDVTKADFEQYEVFRISFTTHSGDLTSLPIDRNVFLISDNKAKVAPAKWIVQSSDSHHPIYLALFPKYQPGKVSLEVGGIGDKPVTFTWE
ncbi:YVTN family beta-propeller repeat protein [Effusibacillus lacus]|uniref:YNCE-like beta-propeller domain-containing protein n=2 Tax=Effusibacillus lacus TaxID=1348429 RepID=A0A292YS73_9BACL|nr:cytochrome D1 domain-containing protein [Effusibacillus lacus]GAX91623.1 hypothetical protein EFBL_3313 [Effusibacillus lacus]